MLLPVVRSTPLRRLLAALLTLSVLLTTLGWAHPPCTAPGAGSEVADAAGRHEPHDAEAPQGLPCDTPHAPADGRQGHDEPDTPASATCVLAAHCATAVVRTSPAAPAPRAELPDRPDVPTDALPRGPVCAPESPPPRA